MAGGEDFLQRLGEFHEEVAGGLGDCFAIAAGVVEGEGGGGEDDEDFLGGMVGWSG